MLLMLLHTRCTAPSEHVLCVLLCTRYAAKWSEPGKGGCTCCEGIAAYCMILHVVHNASHNLATGDNARSGAEWVLSMLLSHSDVGLQLIYIVLHVNAGLQSHSHGREIFLQPEIVSVLGVIMEGAATIAVAVPGS